MDIFVEILTKIAFTFTIHYWYLNVMLKSLKDIRVRDLTWNDFGWHRTFTLAGTIMLVYNLWRF